MPRPRKNRETEITAAGDSNDIRADKDPEIETEPVSDSGTEYDSLLDDINAPDEDDLADIDGVRNEVRNGVGRDFRDTADDDVPLFIVIQQEDNRLKKRTADRKRKIAQRKEEIKEKMNQKNIFKNLDKVKRAEKIKEVCSLKLNSDKIEALYTHSRKLQTFIAEAVAKPKVNWSSLTKDDKIQLLKEYGAKNSAWAAYLAKAVSVCFPRIDIYKTRCNPIEFGNIVFEEVLAPLTHIRAPAQINTWYSNNGDKLEIRMREKMTELVKTRLMKSK